MSKVILKKVNESKNNGTRIKSLRINVMSKVIGLSQKA